MHAHRRLVDAKSASGYVYPRAMLVERGVNPERYFKETIFAGGHDKVISAVFERRVDAGAIYEGALVPAASVALEKSPKGKSAIANSKKNLTGHVVANDGLFDVVRRTARIAGL